MYLLYRLALLSGAQAEVDQVLKDSLVIERIVSL
jgi:hypothetical protein